MKNKNKTKKVTIVTAMAICMVSAAVLIAIKLLGVSFAKNNIKDGDELKSGNAIYNVIDQNDLLVEYMHPIKKTATVSIPDVIKAKGETLKVASIQYDAFKGNKKVKKITIGSKMVFIGAQAFYGCKNLKEITINALNLNADGIQPKAFKGINSKAVIKVPEQRLSEYKKMLKAKGVTGKKQKVIGMKVEEEVPRVTFGPDHPLPEPEYAICSIGNIAKVPINSFDKSKITDSVKYATGDSIPFSSKIGLVPEIYGMFGERESYGWWIRCFVCRRKFCSEESYALHLCMKDNNKCSSHNEFLVGKAAYTETYWVSDDDPCKLVFCATLPDGLSYQEGSMKVIRSNDIEIDSNAYHVDISGHEVTVTIDNIKAMPFFSYDFYSNRDYGGFRYPISILFNAELNGVVAAANTVPVSVSYSYKGLEKTINLGKLNVYAISFQIKNTDASGNTVDGSKFTLYKQKMVYNSAGLGAPQYFELAEATSVDGLLTFKGLGEGKYKLVQTEVPAGYEKMDSLIFNVSMEGNDGSLTSLSVKDKTGKKLPWNVDSKAGVISAIVTN